MRPVPVVFLRLAFSPQLSVNSIPCKPEIPYSKNLRGIIPRLTGNGDSGIRTLASLSSRVAAVSTCVLLDVQRALT